MIAKTITIARITSWASGPNISGAPLDDCGRAIGDHLSHRLAHLRRVESHHHDRVRTHRPSVLDHAVHRVATGVLDEARVLDDLATAESPQPGHDVSAEAPAAHDDAEHLAKGLLHLVAGGALCRRDEDRGHGLLRHCFSPQIRVAGARVRW